MGTGERSFGNPGESPGQPEDTGRFTGQGLQLTLWSEGRLGHVKGLGGRGQQEGDTQEERGSWGTESLGRSRRLRSWACAS